MLPWRHAVLVKSSSSSSGVRECSELSYSRWKICCRSLTWSKCGPDPEATRQAHHLPVHTKPREQHHLAAIVARVGSGGLSVQGLVRARFQLSTWPCFIVLSSL
ncbi:hypothetical protein PoB_003504800 [Plakobranchus ocellatus]|uniref:Uncharacterized protein n=1 Tax=Plakobranchus ocellatus TaxID=259542 RepID=A0AAV4AMM3_9GAST|nr:hypothetical protein PoB_003504800 [Plakobranchus ocellatus]